MNADDPLFDETAVSSIVRLLEASTTAVAAYPDWVSIDQDGNVLEFMRQPDYSLDNMLSTFECDDRAGNVHQEEHTGGNRSAE